MKFFPFYPLFFLLLFVVGCSQGGGVSSENLTQKWTLSTLGVPEALTIPSGDDKVAIEFTQDGKVNGYAGCNRFFGTYTTQGNTISFDGVGMTRRMCDSESMAIEDSLSKLLHGDSVIEIQQETLILKKDQIKAVFTSAQ